MKKAIVLLIALTCLAACRDNTPQYTLNGNYGTGNDTLYIFGLDYRHSKIDTLPTNDKGYFEYTIETDTVIPLTIVLPNGTMLPMYAEPHTKATLTTDEQGYRIDGGYTQSIYDSIANILSNVQERSQLNDTIDAFIKRHPLCEVNIHLLQKYFIEIPDAQNAPIKKRIEELGGTLQDNDYLALIKTKVNTKNSNVRRRAFPTYDYTTKDSTRINRSRYMGKYLLVTFWASWDTASVAHLKKLRTLEQKSDTAYFGMLNIAFDHDTATWSRTIAADSIAGDNVYEIKGWECELAKELTIGRLPFSILVNPFQRIEEYNVATDKLEARLDSLVDKHKKNDKKKTNRRKV